jgi:hypothetical protein
MDRTPDGKGRVTTEGVRTGLERDRALTPVEERALRMRHGVGLRPDAPLARLAPDGSELADELLLLELQLLRQARARTAPRPVSPTKSKIVRALRGKR